MIYIASDHRGFELKKDLVNYFQKYNLPHEDLGPFDLDKDDDYPDYVLKLVERVRSNQDSLGIVICRNGGGVSIMANRFKGIRCGLSWDPKHAVTLRNDDHTNVLALPSEFIDSKLALEIVNAWLTTPYSKEERHLRRLAEVEMYGQE